MKSECRATNPTACPYHGNTTISKLQTQADQAALSGNISEYIALREQMDAAQDALHSQPTEKPTPAKKAPRKNAQQMITDGANAGLKQIADWRKREAPEEETQMVKRGLKEEVKNGLIEGKGKTTPEKIDDMAFMLFESYHQGNPPSFRSHRTPYFQTLAETILKGAAQ